MRKLALFLLCAGAAAAQSAEAPSRAVTDPGVVTTRQGITPAGAQAVFQGRVYGVAFCAAPAELWVLNAGQIFRFDWKNNKVLDRIPVGGTPGLQAIACDPGSGRVYAAAAQKPHVRLFAVAGGKAQQVAGDLGANIAGALAVSRNAVAVPLIYDNKLAVVDPAGGRVTATIPTGIAPFGAALDTEGTVAYVSNWGGRVAKAGDLTARTGLSPTADQVVVDARGIASTGTVTRIDVAAGKATHTVAVGLHPTAIVWDEPRHRVYVANTNSDSISVIDSREQRVVRTIAIEPFEVKTPGIAPTALAVSPDGSRLYAACGGLNAVAVVDAAAGAVLGFIPTAWYPNGLAVSRDGQWLAVSTLLGAGSGWREEPRKRFVHANRGSIAVLPIPDAAQLANYSTAVAENNRLPLGAPKAARPSPRKVAAAAIPERAGEPSLIEHVVYIIKENRTYDQVLGDLPKGNGDPSLVMFGEDVTPNQHRLADTFVVLDNFYASGGNSADGHQWVTQANETSYCLWPGYAGRSYPFDGSDPIAYSRSGFIWDAALRLGKTVRIYGEYAGRMREDPRERGTLLERWKNGADFTAQWNITAPNASVDRLLARNYPSYSPAIPDVVRAQIFLADLKKWVAAGSMPNLTLVQLPSNHTYGASPGTSTAKAMVADNDLALGQIVEALTRSPFWKKMAIFVVEDDAQNGVDHVDGHRTAAFIASPYARRGHVDSTFYSHQSILKSIELILGLPTLSLFDLIANDMRASFTNTPDFTGYEHVTPRQSLFEMTPALKALRGEARKDAIESAKMRWDVPDAAPTERLNRIVWRQVRGFNVPYPGARQAIFAPLSVDLDDDER
ncbi:MAG: alkaline phosphatase family protein [Bryobacteraceae bacterium]